jgi:hypothetical protein
MANHDQDATEPSTTIPPDGSETPLSDDDLQAVSGGLPCTGGGAGGGVCVAD